MSFEMGGNMKARDNVVNVYVSGPLTDVPNEMRQSLRDFYERIGTECSKLGFKPYVPHVHSDPIQFAHLTPFEVDGLDRAGVLQSNLIIAYVGIPAIGVGIEIEIANDAGIPV